MEVCFLLLLFHLAEKELTRKSKKQSSASARKVLSSSNRSILHIKAASDVSYTRLVWLGLYNVLEGRFLRLH